jgi:hypothetical protein
MIIFQGECQMFLNIWACLYDPGQAGRDAYRDPARIIQILKSV